MAVKKDTPKKPEEKKAEVVAPVKPIVPVVALPRAFYIEKTNGSWKLVTADVDGAQLVNRKEKDCDNKALSLENFKIQFAKYYYFGK